MGVRLTVAALASLWLAAGAVGTVRYVHGYWMYRGFPPPVVPSGIPKGRQELVSFYSPALGHVRRYLVCLPPGYAAQAAAGRRFPVLYLLHAPPGRPDGFVQAGALTVYADVLLAHHQIRPAVYVLPYGKSGTFGNDTEWANARAGRYESFVMDVVHNVDRRFATLRDRRHRGLAGLSEGGYGAINIGLHHLGDFSVLQSWSGYFVQTPTGPFQGLPQADLTANSPGLYLGGLAPRIRRLGERVFLYQGVRDEIRPFRIRLFARQLYQAGAYVRYGFYPGGHDWGLWRREMPHMLRVASDWFATPPAADRLHHAPRGHGRPQHPRAGHANPSSPNHHRRHVALA
ncbi:MAG: alpha/beta hydrolase [Solirubrobacteraceae bacterium]